jgi:hypothetical protein
MSDDRYTTPEQFAYIDALVNGTSRALRTTRGDRRESNRLSDKRPAPRRRQVDRTRLQREVQAMKLRHEPLQAQYHFLHINGVDHRTAMTIVEGHIP